MEPLSRNDLREERWFESVEDALDFGGDVYCLAIEYNYDAALLARIAELSTIQELYFSDCDVSQLLPLLPGLRNLESLSLYECGLESVPESVRELPRLSYLDLDWNGIVEIPSWVNLLQSLRTFTIRGNEVRTLPQEFFELVDLQYLGMSDNCIEVLPDAIGDMQGLRSLYLFGNCLKTMPASIGKLHGRLRTLSLKDNPFESLPKELEEFWQSESLDIDVQYSPLFLGWSYVYSNRDPAVYIDEDALKWVEGNTEFDSLREAIVEYQLEERKDEILSAVRSAIVLKPAGPDTRKECGHSRFCGQPDLPDKALLPKEGKRSWHFLCQIDLGEVTEWNSYLPQEGLLSFFLHPSNSKEGRVLFHEGPRADLQRVKARRWRPFDLDDHPTKSPIRMELSHSVALPEKLFRLTDEEALRYGKLREAMGYREGQQAINGYSPFIYGKSVSGKVSKSREGLPEEWVELLSIRWDKRGWFDPELDYATTFLIHREDLMRRDFDRVVVEC